MYPKKNVFDQKWGYMWELVGVFGSYVPQAVLIDPWAFHVDVLKGKKSVLRKTDAYFYDKIGTCLAQILGFCLNRLSF